MTRYLKLCLLSLALTCCSHYTFAEKYDLVISGGVVIDGTGSPGKSLDIGIRGDKIVKIGKIKVLPSDPVLDAKGFVVSPGFINVLSWAVDSLVSDGRGLSDVMQGVTLEVFGEGSSMGPLSPANKLRMQKELNASAKPYQIEWTSLAEYLDFLVNKGVSPNVASFIGATTVRANVIGLDNRQPTQIELKAMQVQVRKAMQEGALGVGSSLIYAPAFYAKTDELTALAKIAGEYNGMYISHIRSEGNRFLESLDELITIARNAKVSAEVYHLKAAGMANWPKMKLAIARIEKARAKGLNITADMYTYPAGATGLDAAMPPWVQAGGYQSWKERLQKQDIKQKVIAQMREPTDEWENLLLASGAKGVLLPYFQNPELKQYTGMTLAAVADKMGLSPEEAAIELVIADGTRVSAIYFLMSEQNIRLKIKQPWLSFGSDAAALDPEVDAKLGSAHPRGYGNFARVFAKYVREDKVLSLQEAIRKMTGLPAKNLKIQKRGLLKEGFFADIVIFDPNSIQDHATFEKPHTLASGVSQVFINGVHVVKDKKHTGATPGKVVYGPGWKGWGKTTQVK